MNTWFLGSMNSAYVVGLLAVLFLFCLVPLAVFSENPGLTPGGCAQLVAIVITVCAALLMIRRKTVAGRIFTAGLAYITATFLSNLIAMALNPHLLH